MCEKILKHKERLNFTCKGFRFEQGRLAQSRCLPLAEGFLENRSIRATNYLLYPWKSICDLRAEYKAVSKKENIPKSDDFRVTIPKLQTCLL